MQGLVAALKEGGTVVQRMFTEALVRAGAYRRLEQSFEGVTMDFAGVDITRGETWNQLALVLSRMRSEFLTHVMPAFLEIQARKHQELTDPPANAFLKEQSHADIMPNVMRWAAVAAKAKAVADEAIAQARAGKKPIITLMNTYSDLVREVEMGPPSGWEDPPTRFVMQASGAWFWDRSANSDGSVQDGFLIEENNGEYTLTQYKGGKIIEIADGEESVFWTREEAAAAAQAIALKELGSAPTFRQVLLRQVRRMYIYSDTEARNTYLQGRRERGRTIPPIEHKMVPWDEMSPDGTAISAYYGLKSLIESDEFAALDEIPASPIDYIKMRMEAAGFSIGEISGRSREVAYNADGTLRKGESGRYVVPRPGRESGDNAKNETVASFNDGTLDAIIQTRAGSTGISLHSSSKFEDQKPRVMIVAQPEANITEFVQTLGRIHRVGQVNLPEYKIMFGTIPHEARLAAMLQAKMRTLNAAASGVEKTALSLDDENTLDMMNSVGNRIAVEWAISNQGTYRYLGQPFGAINSFTRPNPPPPPDDAFKKLTGRLPLLVDDDDVSQSLQRQEDIYSDLAHRYVEAIEEENQMGVLRSDKVYDLDAVYLRGAPVSHGSGSIDSHHPYGMSLNMFLMDAAGSPHTVSEINEILSFNLPEASRVPRLANEDEKERLETLRDVYRDLVGGEVRAREGVWATVASLPEGMFPNLREEVEAYRETLPPQAKAEFERYEDVFVRRVIRNHRPGAFVNIQSTRSQMGMRTAGGVRGFVLGFKRKSTAATNNPLSPGLWKIRIATTDARREAEVSARPIMNTRLMHLSDSLTRSEMDDVLSEYEQQAGQHRRTRYVFQGNILLIRRHVEQGNIPGSYISFTTKDGRTETGYLIDDDLDMSAVANAMPVIHAQDAQALAIWLWQELRAEREGRVWTEGGLFSVRAKAPRGGSPYLGLEIWHEQSPALSRSVVDSAWSKELTDAGFVLTNEEPIGEIGGRGRRVWVAEIANGNAPGKSSSHVMPLLRRLMEIDGAFALPSSAAPSWNVALSDSGSGAAWVPTSFVPVTDQERLDIEAIRLQEDEEFPLDYDTLGFGDNVWMPSIELPRVRTEAEERIVGRWMQQLFRDLAGEALYEKVNLIGSEDLNEARERAARARGMIPPAPRDTTGVLGSWLSGYRAMVFTYSWTIESLENTVVHEIFHMFQDSGIFDTRDMNALRRWATRDNPQKARDFQETRLSLIHI